MDERLAEVEAVRERNQRLEAEAEARVRRLAAQRASNIPVIFNTFIRTFPGKSLMENEGKDHISLDNFGMGSIYVIKCMILEENHNSGKIVRFTIKDLGEA